MYQLILCRTVGKDEAFYSIINSNDNRLRTLKFAGIDISRKPCIKNLLKYCYRNNGYFINRDLTSGYIEKLKQIIIIKDIVNFNSLNYSDIYNIIYDIMPEELL